MQALQASLNHEINNAVECDNVHGTYDTGNEQHRQEPPDKSRPAATEHDREPADNPGASARIAPGGIVCPETRRTAPGSPL